MAYIPCSQRRFPLRMNFVTYYPAYSRWLRHLAERVGPQHALSIWEDAFAAYDDQLLGDILGAGWSEVESKASNQLTAKAEEIIAEFFPVTGSRLAGTEAKKMINRTPPIPHIKQLFSTHTVEKEIPAYHALHIRFDGLAYLAETLIDKYGKEGELMVYDLMIEGRLASGEGNTGSVEEFISEYVLESDTPTLFTAGLRMEVISKSDREAVVEIQECEWARYFQERHPRVGYLMACSTDEIACKSFNPSLRLQRTGTIMEGKNKCDFRIYAVEDNPPGG